MTDRVEKVLKFVIKSNLTDDELNDLIEELTFFVPNFVKELKMYKMNKKLRKLIDWEILREKLFAQNKR